MPKRCAIVADADLTPPDAEVVAENADGDDEEPDLPEKQDLAPLESDYVKVFLGATTFEREITLAGNLGMLARASKSIGAPRIAKKLAAAHKQGTEPSQILKKSVLSTAKRFGKARFAQLAAENISTSARVPGYVSDAVTWLLEA